MTAEMVRLHAEIKKGADKIIDVSAKTSKHEPCMAIAQLLLAAACLAKAVKCPKEDFIDAFARAIDDAEL